MAARGSTHWVIFQSTPSPRRATAGAKQEAKEALISIHALPAEGDFEARLAELISSISIHALPAEGDLCYNPLYNAATIFQSTPSPRRATLCGVSTAHAAAISIHALPAEGD